MKLFSGLLGSLNRKTVSTTVSLSLLSTVMVVAAVQSDGSSATNVRLDDGSVWVTNQADQRVGRLNIRIQELDFATSAAAGLDVVQDGRSVFFSGPEGGVQQIEVDTGQKLGSNETLIADYQANGRIGLVLDRSTGRLWVGRGEFLTASKFPDEPDALVEEDSFALITAEAGDPGGGLPPLGKVVVVDRSGWWELELDDNLKPVREVDETGGLDDGEEVTSSTSSTTTTIAELAPDGSIPEAEPEPIRLPDPKPLPVDFNDIASITSVGHELAFLLVDGSVVTTDGTPVDVPGEEHVLQQPSYEGDEVLVASTKGLFSISIDDGSLETLSTASASPAEPVRVGPCVFGAWSGDTPTYFKRCGDQTLKDQEPIVGAAPDIDLVWRVNQRNVALNSPGDGGVWADHDGSLAFAGNWSDVEPEVEDSEEQDDTTGESQRIVERTCIEGGAQAPTAGDDELGVRPRQTIIDVLNNDDDINCEPIAIASVSPTGDEWGQLTIINDGQHILYSPSDAMLTDSQESVQPFQFTYVVEDSSGNNSQPATVTVTVKDPLLGNLSPALRPKTDDSTRQMRTVVEAGRAVSYNVLADWWDPDGDNLRLVSAIPEDQGEVSATPDGVVRYAANGVGPGIQRVSITMSDGLLQTTETLEVTVKPTGSVIPPVVENDFLTLVEGQTGTVLPLANDSDPNENRLDLRPLWLPDDETKFRTALQGNEVTLTAITAGTYALPYEATDGVDATKGFIRLRVIAPAEVNTGPIAVPDQVKLRADRIVNVDVLDNDIDADGDLLAVTNVSVVDAPPELGTVRATIVDRRLVQLEVVPGPEGQPPTGPFTVNYTIDDGRRAERLATQDQDAEVAERVRAIGAVTVLIQPPAEDQPPLLESDSAVVRSGDIVAVPVLRNDIDPDSDEILLQSVDADQALALETSGAGVAWVQGRNVYFKGGNPGRATILYTASAGNKKATSEVVFQVTPPLDPATNPNQAPTPKDLVVRAIRGGVVRVPIPLFGVDADGDSVVLVGEFSGLQGSVQGNRVVVDPENPGVVLFTAGANAGPTDEFIYTVRDPHGAIGTASAQVMVLDDEGWPPQAHDDVFRAKPGRTLSIPVLANDTSPQDRRLELAEEPFFDIDGQPTATPQHPDSVNLLDQQNKDTRGRIEVVVPVDGTTLVEHYRISDGLSPGDAFIRVTPDPDAPNVPPVATLDVIELEDVQGQTEASIDVLLNDFDPDDAEGVLTVSLPANQNATLLGGTMTVPLTEAPQLVLYRLTDADGGEAVGIVRVPGLENHPPILSAAGEDSSLRTIEAGAAAPLPIDLSVIVEDPNGDPDIRLTPTEVVVLGGLGSVNRNDAADGFVYTPPLDLQESANIVIQFEVTDRPEKTLEERELNNCRCLAKLEVVVVIEASSPPRIISDGAVQVPQLDEEVSYDLAPLVIDDQGDALTFTLNSSTYGGLEVTQSGSQITLVSSLAEDQKIPVGSVIPIRYTVEDGKFDPVDGTVNVTMIATNKGQPAAGTFPQLEAERDVSIDTPNFVDAASNPFPDRPLTLLNPTVSGTGAEITCSETGDCQFLSTEVGEFTVTYTLKDAVDQTATGTMTVVVKGKPRPPGVPSIESVGNNVVSLTWTAADDQGSDIVRYHVTAVNTGVTKIYTTTGGEFDGLTNGTTYQFTVLAENELGMGEASDESTPAIPDRVPDPPVSPAIIDYADGTLTLQWEPPPTADEFTAILQYEVSIGGQTLLVDGSTTALVVGASGSGDTLNNGTDYQFRVRAQNSATVDNGWGAFGVLSGPEKPSRFPDSPTGVSAAHSGDGGTPRLTVTWSAPAFDGGRAIDNYRVCRVQDPGNCQTTSSLQATFDLPRNQVSSFAVIAFNSDKNKNDSPPSSASPALTTVGDPDAPVISSVSTGDKTLTAFATTANNSGCSQYTIEYQRTGSSGWQTSPTFTSGISNGTNYTIVARATLSPSCGTSGVTYRSVTSAGVGGTPYGPLRTPTMTARRSGTTVWFEWQTNRLDDGRSNWRATLSGSGSGCSGTVSSAQGATGSTPQTDIGYSATRNCTITISATGASSRSASDSETTGPAPPPPGVITVTRGGTGANGNGTTPCAGCFWQRVAVSSFPNGTFTVRNSIQTVVNPSMTVTGGTGSVGDGWWFCGSGTYTVTIVTPVNTYTQNYTCRT